ncbi:hypothetical protein [Streptomyces tailanensis]|uniref:hypothetical protein n=1 Tax=Streptomyces tailanensis TaxID=2569858 RepID=UPI001FE40B5D|nr:hypothetical protein [Streptomyces tailanensis]
MISRATRAARRLRAGAGRRVRRPFKALASWMLLRIFLPRRTRVGRLHYAAVLDGQTVNLHAELPDSLPLPEHAEIELTRGRERHTCPARVYEDTQGRLLCDAAVLLGDGLGGLPVRDGHWKVRLRTRTGPRSRKLALLLVELPEPYAGPTMPHTVSPITGQSHRLTRSVTGSLRIVTTTPRPLAEVVRVDLSHTGLVVDFRLVGASTNDLQVEFAASGRRLTRPVTPLPDDSWRVHVPLAEMPPDRRDVLHWDVTARLASGQALRIGRHVHDVRNPQRVFGIAALTVAPPGAAPLIVHPRYTPAGNFRVTCSRMPESGRRT